MKNMIFNKTERFVGRDICDHACQIFCSKGNRETMYHWFFFLEITVVKTMNNLNVCSAHTIYTHDPSLMEVVTTAGFTVIKFYDYKLMFLSHCMCECVVIG